MVPVSVVSATISILSRVISLLKAVLFFRIYVRGREGLLDRRKWKESVRLGPDGRRFHGGWYLALEGESRWQYAWGDESPQDITGEAMDHDPPQGNNIRLELIEEGSHGPEDTLPLDTGLMQLSTQWRQAHSAAWHHITIYETALPKKVRRYINVLGEGEERRVIIECNTYARRGSRDGVPAFYSTKLIRKQLKQLDATYIAVRSKDNWKKLFLLQFHHACLRLFFEFLTALEADEKEHADNANTDSGFAELWQWNLRTMTQRSYEYRDLAEMGRKLISIIECLIDVVRASPPVVDSTSHANKFMTIDMELRGLCREANERIRNFSDQLDHDLKYLELARDINQTRGVQQLTLLATIFLPLSLAAGVLSMQTRFKDLGTLLYDFFGVVVLLAAIVLFLMILLYLIAVVNEADSKLRVRSSWYREDVRGILLLTLNIGLLVFGCLVLSSFLVGMFKDVSLGAKILGYGVAAICGIESIIATLRARGNHTHKVWETCLMKLEQLQNQEAEVNVFAVLDTGEDAYNEVILDLKDFSQLQSEAEEDPSVLLRVEADVLVIDTFCTELAKTREILFGNATSESGEPVERFTGIDKLFTEALPQLQKFFSEQKNTEIVLLMVLEIIQAQGFVEEQGEGKWLQPLKHSLGEDLYEQIVQAGEA
ncbi:hypothetical protein H9Q72_014029 [Fusarium xylarioides]|uniref:Uncharacterized protein n=1 Tax=Fusarium xylarioides TaxID=221167 RepID=A0A9P7KYX2_9HYPO|nr:hypothetical protein H9Q72_014029 [Fusarium xylarioides]